jgi:hypothetical protein
VKRLHDLQKNVWKILGEVATREEYEEFYNSEWPDPVEACYKANFGFKARLAQILNPQKTASPFGGKWHSGKIYKIRNFGYLRYTRSPRVKPFLSAVHQN